ncbi:MULTISPECIES: GNAT family N-acetyltransferase [Flavobacteriaceae]|uniref:GNAT family N-acetyltransferase n=2 Tax=Flavobacteriaceae TaxID=49546 RepID=A0A4Y8AUW3_9FLAO|nr:MULTISPECIES: GNAT family N-acetyltransferase [Flavobacteriaceae]TEW76336.1 GNAT family N-acetyltransferase [Gramella jeungdoensis]GGK52026.1 N-acetyltransferase [Lutibacter litoralis]
MIEIKNISAQETYAIRLEVLRKDIDLPYKFNGDLDKDTFHLGAFKEDKLIAVSSFMKVKNRNFKGLQYQLRGMATLTQYQGFGIGKQLIIKAEKILKPLNIDCLWCNARVIAVDFYKKQGFKTFGEVFDIPLIGGHYSMYKYLT